MRFGRRKARHARQSCRLGAERRAKALILAVAGLSVLTTVVGGSVASAAPPTTFYAAPVAVGTGDCTTPANACPIDTAVAKTGDGDTVVLTDGTYVVPGTSPLPGRLDIATSITLRAAPGAHPVVKPSTPSAAVIYITGAAVTIDGLTVTDGSEYGVFTAPSTSAGGSVALRHSTLVNNTAGLGAYDSNTSVVDSTIANNSGDGIITNNLATPTVRGSTIAHNGGDGLHLSRASSVDLAGSIVAGNRIDCFASGTSTVLDHGFNISSDGNCGLTATGSVSASLTITGLLAPLADNGGPTPTMALLAGSPAIGLITGTPTGGGSVCGTADQRGYLRPGPPCDAGAFQTGQVTTATAPSFTDNACISTGPAGASYTIPSITGVRYLVNGSPASAGTQPAVDGSSITVTAQPEAGYVLTGPTSWTHTYSPTPSCPQMITFTTTPPASPVVGDNYTVAATGGGSGQPVIFTPGSPTVCTVTDSTVQFIAAGSCVVDANQAGAAGYLPAPQVTQTITVGKAAQVITFTSTPPATPMVREGYTVAATGGASGNPVVFTSGSPAVCTMTGSTVLFVATGSCVVDANQAGDANYNPAPEVAQTIAVGKAAQAITFTSPPPAAPIVGDSYPVAATGGGSGQPVRFSSGSPAICTVTGSSVKFIAAGTCVVDANQAGDATYNPAPQLAQIITVAAAPAPPSSSTPPPSTTPPTQPTPQPSGIGLASTGSPTAELTVLAVLLVAGGGLLLLLARRPLARYASG
ncbi:MAG: autotransporter beta-domain protein, partial [Pseudonocardiales bacterium]|nr:autotransporter beta-domain protein [Pseudonocardiales bacterium]